MSSKLALVICCLYRVSINAIKQSDPATFTLSDVSQLIYFISYTAPAAHGKQNTITTFCQLFFEILRPKNVPLLPVTRPTLKKFKFANPNFVYYCTENDTTKNSCAGKWERNYSFTQRPYGKPKKVKWILKLDWILSESFFFSCVLFMSIFTGFRVYWCIVYMRVSLFFLALSFLS